MGNISTINKSAKPVKGSLKKARRKITTFLWLDDRIEEALGHYISIFKHGKILKITRNEIEGDPNKGTVMLATFEIEGQEFCVLNGGPSFRYKPGISCL